MRPFIHFSLVGILLFASGTGITGARETAAHIECEGSYARHLQGICRDEAGNLFWSFTTELVKTDPKGTLIKKVPVADHHGDLCFANGKIYVAVNLGKFNDPKGNANSIVYVYDAATLNELAKHPVPEVFHGAGGMDSKDGNFFVVGGLPDGVEENYVYEYDANFNFVKKHIVNSGWTLLGIQSATFHDGSWWFGCYGRPAEVIKTGPDFKIQEKFNFNGALGIVGTAPGTFLIATGPKTETGKCRGVLQEARVTDNGKLAMTPSEK